MQPGYAQLCMSSGLEKDFKAFYLYQSQTWKTRSKMHEKERERKSDMTKTWFPEETWLKHREHITFVLDLLNVL